MGGGLALVLPNPLAWASSHPLYTGLFNCLNQYTPRAPFELNLVGCIEAQLSRIRSAEPGTSYVRERGDLPLTFPDPSSLDEVFPRYDLFYQSLAQYTPPRSLVDFLEKTLGSISSSASLLKWHLDTSSRPSTSEAVTPSSGSIVPWGVGEVSDPTQLMPRVRSATQTVTSGSKDPEQPIPSRTAPFSIAGGTGGNPSPLHPVPEAGPSAPSGTSQIASGSSSRQGSLLPERRRLRVVVNWQRVNYLPESFGSFPSFDFFLSTFVAVVTSSGGDIDTNTQFTRTLNREHYERMEKYCHNVLTNHFKSVHQPCLDKIKVLTQKLSDESNFWSTHFASSTALEVEHFWDAESRVPGSSLAGQLFKERWALLRERKTLVERIYGFADHISKLTAVLEHLESILADHGLGLEDVAARRQTVALPDALQRPLPILMAENRGTLTQDPGQAGSSQTRVPAGVPLLPERAPSSRGRNPRGRAPRGRNFRAHG